MCVKKGGIFAAILTAFIFLNIAFLTAEENLLQQSQKEKVSLLQIDKLIKNEEYSQALQKCADYIEQNPENFDLVKSRIDKIMSIRRRYNFVEGRLIDLANNEPGEAEKNYQMVLELEKIEKNPSVVHGTIRNEIKNLSQFKACQARFNEIIEAAIKDLENEKYTLAMQEFKNKDGGKQNAFEIYRDDFYAERTAREAALAESAVEEISSSLDSFGLMQKNFNTCLENFYSACDRGITQDISSAYKTLEEQFDLLVQIRKKITDSADRLNSLFNQLDSNGEMTDASYLPFVCTFVSGLKNDVRSGITGVIDSQYVSTANKVNEKLALLCSKKSSAFSKVLSMSDKNKLSDYEKAIFIADSASKLYDKAEFKISDTNKIFTLQNRILTAKNYTARAFIVLDYASKIDTQINSLSSMTLPLDFKSAVRNKNDTYAQKLLDFTDSFMENRKNICLEANVHSFTSEENPYLVRDSFEAAQTLCRNYEVLCDENLSAVWKKIADFYSKGSDDILTENKSSYEKISLYLPETTSTDMEEKINFQYPNKVLNEIGPLKKQTADDIKSISFCKEKLDEAKNYKNLFEEDYERIEQIISQLKTLTVSISALENKAKNQQKIAKLLRQEAEVKFNEAKQFLSKNNFNAARNALQTARDKYNQSLDAQDDKELRLNSDKNLSELGNKINTTENEYVVRDVRNFKNQAKTAYYNGNFEEADNLLSRAEQRWAITNVEKDEEIESLKALVNTALSMKTGRVIPPSAPLYPEMSQILSLANQYYSKGQKLKNQGKDEEGNKILNQAKQKLNELKLVYPLNQEASILTLKIDQLLDRKAFNLMFSEKIEAAKVNCKSKDNSIKQQAYSDLLDLSQINPDYPGLKDFIYNTEIELGLRQKPVDNSALVKAQSLANEAKRILNSAGRDSAKLQQARQKALEAYRLNPNNSDALAVMDQVALKTGGKAAVVISAEDEKLYQSAIRELQRNNIIAANTIVQQLWSKASNRNAAKIIELKKKVEALL